MGYLSASRVARASDTRRHPCQRPEGSGDVVPVAARQIRHDTDKRAGNLGSERQVRHAGGVRWSDIDMYQHVNHIPWSRFSKRHGSRFLKFFRSRHHVHQAADRRCQVTWGSAAVVRLAATGDDLDQVAAGGRLHARVRVRSVNAGQIRPGHRQSQLAAFHIEEQQLDFGIATPSRVPAAVVSGIGGVVEAWVVNPDPAHRADLATFVDHALIDDAAVIHYSRGLPDCYRLG